ncbi:tryptophan synthase subunit alpha [Candidatus Oleimmundimicrobium sp.]|uniref:tryptophan synthase subunit alpha n=1 Tax=Candidatus Oleimmundimicrobium sp. TaxID=3060597 RepID=UPI002728A40F|nr:tryptophan synthase subunit alpha [Candidatus Oleimmundimicrobium sp.]MDO8886653.1 tryptophan synthase subunit alpha [Candidatus Oleimmundimicrobium sp.]
MSRIKQKFKQLKKNNKKAFIPYVTGGYPSLDACERLIEVLAENGADIIEIGIPYSDPLADGPTIQKASQIAISRGANTKNIFGMIKNLKKKIDVPLVIMTYYNTIYRYGEKKFAEEAAYAGVDGLIVPDLPPEEARSWRALAKKNALDTIFLISPTSSDDRIKEIVSASSGFIYCVSLTGVTGARNSMPLELSGFLSKVRSLTDKPLAVGFGISSANLAKEVSRLADGIIIGSALIDLINDSDIKYDKIIKFVKNIKLAMETS